MPPIDIGMHHPALNRPGAHDGDLNHEIIEFAGLHPWQEIHLRSALYLENTNRIGHTKHVIGSVIFLRDGRYRQRCLLVQLQ